MTPAISFVCVTYNRPPTHLHLLEEAVESFCRNRAAYAGECEMILLNDAPAQELVADVPGLRIINAPTRYTSLGAKMNDAIEAASGEVILPQDDDDISLAHRASLSVEMLGDADYFNPKAHWYMPAGQLIHEQMKAVAHNCSAFRKSAWRKVGGYPHLSGAQDQHLDGALRRFCRVVDGPLSAQQSFFIYRWGVSPCHLSGTAPHDDFYRAVGTWPVQPGRFEIKPAWRQDYAALCQAAL